jgi:hypothetical protein
LRPPGVLEETHAPSRNWNGRAIASLDASLVASSSGFLGDGRRSIDAADGDLSALCDASAAERAI